MLVVLFLAGYFILEKLISSYMKSSDFCRYRFTVPADKQWGVMDENGTWDGIAGDIQRKVQELQLLTMQF